ncbi:MAG: PadR family transcriptional regulator [Clostridia bacterium]|nr:PadR family transcriptional regulator [Clostridia bacterium]
MEQSISSDLIRGHIDTIILHTLLSGDKFAQQISDSIDEKSGNAYKINQATLYSSLKRLESLKFVVSYWNDSENGRRKYFKLTESGKTCVEDNLSNWSYSRSIIDKLMDCAPTPIYQTKIVEKIVEVPVEVEKIVTIEKPSTTIDTPVQEVSTEKTTETSSETTQEVNFRNLLNGLIKANVINVVEPEPVKQVEQENIKEIIIEKPKFNETIDTTVYSDYKGVDTGKIDFGDLSLKAAKEGYKLRISSKETLSVPGNLLINKLNLASSLITLLLFALQFFFILRKFGDLLPTAPIIIILSLASVYPVYTVVKFIIAPNERSKKTIGPDKILTASIIVFNLLLVTFAVNLLTDVDFSNAKTIIFSLAIPSILYVNALVFYLVKFLLAKTKKYIAKKEKTA